MKDTQLSVYVANRPGELARIAGCLARFGANIKAISVADATDYGVVRMIVNEPGRAGAALREEGYGFVTTEVVVAEVADRPGALSEVCGKLADAGINIRYVYATVTPGGGVATAVFSTEDNDRAEQMITG